VIFPTEAKLLAAQKILNENEIFARRYFYPSLNKLPYLNAECCPVSENISSRILCLPLYAELEKDNIEKICDLINSTLQ
jgi:dTDP-4-amino-4,6-dideoxygalactose transaminase